MADSELRIHSGEVRTLGSSFISTADSASQTVSELHRKNQAMEGSLDTQSYAALDASMQAVMKAQAEFSAALTAHGNTLFKVADIADQTAEQFKSAFSSLHNQP